MTDQLQFFSPALSQLPRTWTVQQMAALTGMTTVSIQSFARDGIIEKLGHGDYPFEALPTLFAYYREKSGGKHIKTETHVSDRELKQAKLAAEKRKEEAVASLRELDLAERERTLLPADEVQKAMLALMESFKSQLSNLPNSNASMVRLAQSDAEALELLETAVNNALHELSRFDIALAMAALPEPDDTTPLIDEPSFQPSETTKPPETSA